MNDNEIIDRLVRINEKLVDINAELMRKQAYITHPYIIHPSTPITYPAQRPTTWPSPIVTCDTGVDA